MGRRGGGWLIPVEQIYFSDADYCIAESLALAAGNPHGIVDYFSIVENPDLTVAVAAVW